jgi:hypothetical protein
MSLYYDRLGQPIFSFVWSEKIENRKYARIGYKRFGGLRVSTVWLGLDHGFGDGPPLIFETMVFDNYSGKGIMLDGKPIGLIAGKDRLQWRYATEAEARKGHMRAVYLTSLAAARRRARKRKR